LVFIRETINGPDEKKHSAGSQIVSPEIRLQAEQAMFATSQVAVWRSAPDQMQ
jgi:hypothetical protein